MSLRLTLLALSVAIALAWGVPMSAVGIGEAAAEPGLGDFFSAPVVKPPKPHKSRGERCVAPTEFMRRNHMDMLDHQRDGTVHDGIRTKRYSLNECISCHAVNGPDAKPVTVKDPKHFCRVCHDYASVSMDCFQCHASRPVEGALVPGKGALLPGGAPGHGGGDAATALAAYLRSTQR